MPVDFLRSLLRLACLAPRGDWSAATCFKSLTATLVQVSLAATPRVWPFANMRPTMGAVDCVEAARNSGERAGKTGLTNRETQTETCEIPPFRESLAGRRRSGDENESGILGGSVRN